MKWKKTKIKKVLYVTINFYTWQNPKTLKAFNIFNKAIKDKKIQRFLKKSLILHKIFDHQAKSMSKKNKCCILSESYLNLANTIFTNSHEESTKHLNQFLSLYKSDISNHPLIFNIERCDFAIYSTLEKRESFSIKSPSSKQNFKNNLLKYNQGFSIISKSEMLKNNKIFTIINKEYSSSATNEIYDLIKIEFKSKLHGLR